MLVSSALLLLLQPTQQVLYPQYGANLKKSIQGENEEDTRLIRAVAAAAATHAPIHNIELTVGYPAAINTYRIRKDCILLDMTELELDKSHTNDLFSIKDVYQAKYVVYWVRPVAGVLPKILGIAWNHKAIPTLFFAIGYAGR